MSSFWGLSVLFSFGWGGKIMVSFFGRFLGEVGGGLRVRWGRGGGFAPTTPHLLYDRNIIFSLLWFSHTPYLPLTTKTKTHHIVYYNPYTFHIHTFHIQIVSFILTLLLQNINYAQNGTH